MHTDAYFLNKALDQARLAFDVDEVPIGAIVVSDNNIVGTGFNQKETSQDPTAHAEVQAIKMAAQTLNNWRLSGCVLYATLEPCPMCAGAILQSRLKRIVYGAKDLKWGGVETKMAVLHHDLFNHNVEVCYSELPESVTLLKAFFKLKRQK